MTIALTTKINAVKEILNFIEFRINLFNPWLFFIKAGNFLNFNFDFEFIRDKFIFLNFPLYLGFFIFGFLDPFLGDVVWIFLLNNFSFKDMRRFRISFIFALKETMLNEMGLVCEIGFAIGTKISVDIFGFVFWVLI